MGARLKRIRRIRRSNIQGTGLFHAWHSKIMEGKSGYSIYRRPNGETVKVTSVHGGPKKSNGGIGWPDVRYKGLFFAGYRATGSAPESLLKNLNDI